MKFVKLSIFALTMGLFIASCGGNTEEATENADTMAAPAVEAAPAPAPATTDSAATATPATDTAAAAAAPAAH